MDAVKFIEERRRMYKVTGKHSPTLAGWIPAEDVVKEVEEWSAAHPRKTRQSVFLEQWPEAELDKLIDKIKKFYEKHFKTHCPDCGGVMDGDQLDMTINKIIYTCRECGKEWF